MDIFPEIDIPVLPTVDFVIFPGVSFPLMVKKERSLSAVERALGSGGWLVALANKSESLEVGVDNLAKTGVIGKIKNVKPGKNGVRVVVFEAVERFQVTTLRETDSGIVASGSILSDHEDADKPTLKSLLESIQATAMEVLDLLPGETSSIAGEVQALDDPKLLSHTVAQYMNLTRVEAQEVLEIRSLKNRLLRLLELLASKKESLKVQSRIRETISENVGKKQRDAMLREQLKAIQEELGEGNEGPTAVDYRERIAAAQMPEEAEQVALREAGRLERMGEQSAETHVIRNYLDLLCDMPWNKKSEAGIDLDRAAEILDRDHYGLKKIKQRIVEHLAVMKLRPEKRGSVLLFVGPPGVGKTSLGKSVAEALGRTFVRASLGGVRDDADIRGHRRTYVGALPGRIIDGIRRSKSKDPVFVLDEIDKLARGWGGDPSSALLEVLDPEQNNSFHDHYLDVPFDLSEVVFIGTANSKETIPGPLLDRMEVIDLGGYTADEKFHIAQDHLLPAELESHGLKAGQIELQDEALSHIIEGYTREAGVRSLRRELAKICRAAAALIARAAETTVVIDKERVTGILGPVRFEMEEVQEQPVAGVVTGMAWTPVGGDVLYVEAAVIPGEGKITVTGQLGDVMKESSQIAVSLARAKLEGIAKTVLYRDKDIHLHVPGGAVPKDGPSAGVTLFTAVASMMLGLPVNPKLAMTGEVTLRGRVMPVGGIKEKVVAAVRFGITEIILPLRNARDLEELPDEIRKSVTFHFVSDVDELVRQVFGVLPKQSCDWQHAIESTKGLNTPVSDLRMREVA